MQMLVRGSTANAVAGTGSDLRGSQSPRLANRPGLSHQHAASPKFWTAQSISHHEMKPWLKPLFAGMYRGIDSLQGLLGGAKRISQPSTVVFASRSLSRFVTGCYVSSQRALLPASEFQPAPDYPSTLREIFPSSASCSSWPINPFGPIFKNLC